MLCAFPAILITGVFLLVALPGRAQLRSVETDDLRLVFYDARHTYLAPQLMKSFANAWAFHKHRFHYEGSGKVTVLLEDFGDFGHGGADIIPSNHVDVGIAPFSYIYETVPANERMSWMMNHELAHVAEMDGSAGSDRAFRKIFGGKIQPNEDDPLSMAYGYLTTPRRYSPRWYHEGAAVFLETWMSGGLGRSLGGYDEMVFRAMVRDDARIYDVVGLEAEGTTIDFQVGVNSYLYGTRFMSYLASEYGPDTVIEWISRTKGSRAYFSAQFHQVYGRSLDGEWKRWIEKEHEWQKQNLADIRKYPVTSLHRISKQPVGSVSRPQYDSQTGKIFAAVRYPGAMANIATIDPATGAMMRLHDVEGAALFYVTSMALDPKGRKIYYTSDNNDWRDLNELDLATNKSRRTITNFRTGDLVFDRTAGTLWGVQHVSGLSVLTETLPPFEKLTQRIIFPYGADLYDLDISPDGKWISGAMADSSGRQKLVRISTDNARSGGTAYDASRFETIHDFEFNSAAGFVFSPDGKYLYGTSYYTGASNIFRFDTSTFAMDALSNAETGLFWPLPLPDGRLLAFEYTAQGFVPSTLDIQPIEDVSAVKYQGQQVVEKFPAVKEWKLTPNDTYDVAAATRAAGVYRAWKQMKFVSAYPIVQGYKDSTAYGVRADFSDGVGLASLHVTGSYSPDTSLLAKERAHFSADFRNWGWKLSGYYNAADFYDLFGPTKTSRKGYGGRADYHKSLRYKPPRLLDLDWGVAAYGGLDRLPDYQNVVAPVSQFLTGKVSLSYSRLEKTLGAIEDERGVHWQITSRGNIVHSDFYPRLYGQYDYGILTPMRNSSVWIRASAGKSFGELTEPFANFYFGAFGNNYVDHLATSRYREYYSFPGVELNQVGSTDFAKTLVEWNLTPLRFPRLGAPYFYCNWARLTLFSGFLADNIANDANRVLYGDAGMQADFRLVIASYLNTTFSVGWAGATDKNGRRSQEVMVSLKLL